LVLLVFTRLFNVGVQRRDEGAARGLFRRAAVLQEGAVVVVLDYAHASGKTQRRRELHLIFRLVRPVAPPFFGGDEERLAEPALLAGEFAHVVEYAVLIYYVRGLKFPSRYLVSQPESHPGVHHSLPPESFLIILQ